MISDGAANTQQVLKKLTFPANMGPGLRSWLWSVGPELRTELKELISKSVQADDPRLIQHIRKMIIPPQPGVRKVVTPYRVTLQAKYAHRLLKNKVCVFIINE